MIVTSNILNSKPITSKFFSFKDLGTVSVDDGQLAESELLNNHSPGNVDLLIYSRDSPVVSVGKFSDLSDVIGYSHRIVRRISGGSSIFSDKTQIVYAMVFDRNAVESKEDAYAVACELIVKVLNYLGIDAKYKSPNDVIVNGYKISGSAQYRDGSVVMVHGSLILSNESEIQKHIRMKTGDYKGVISVRTLNDKIKREDVSKAFVRIYSDLFLL